MDHTHSPLRRAAITGAAIVGAAALASAAYQETAAARDRRRFTPLGRLVSVGGRRLHVLEEGHGPPTIVVVPALGEGVLSWVRVQRELAAEVRVVLYDRAGIGWSDPPRRGRRTSDGVAEDLRALLAAAGIEPPYVLVAHSLGGIFARRFAARYPGTVAGLVLVDSSHEEQASRRGVHGWPHGRSSCFKNAWQWQRYVLGARRLAAGLGLLHELDADTAQDALPEHAGAYRAMMLSSRERRAVVREILMMARLSEPPRPLESIPLTVITAGRQQIPGWREMQDELAALSADSTHLVAEGAGHYVHLEAPEVVIQAIRDMASKVGPD
ncbi:MAG: alpha/beta fold hydrolase [Streptosporangiaceae bacterium]